MNNNIILFPRHKLRRCDGSCDGCPVCEWRASICETCGGAEGSLTKECPQFRMAGWQQNLVMAGRLDFVRGGWRVRPTIESEPTHLERLR